jgi:predicted Ser/Thr protein kinase
LIALADVATADLPNSQFVPLSVGELSGRIPGIELTELIGRGGMGAVYRGHQTDLNREVAVKILPQSLSNDPVFLSRFRREAQALAKLDHPNIVTVFGSGVADGLCYIVMEYIEGTTLREAMAAKAVDPASALRIVPQICDALAYAHDHGIVHRDIKPENILLGMGGKVKVVDFGLAKLSDDDRAHTMLTATGARLGTLRYMAPEQLDGTPVDHRADVYSLGVVFYEMLTGQVPMGRFAMPSEKVGIDPRIDDVIMRTLCREPAERYQHVSDVENELLSISESAEQVGWNSVSRRPAGREWKSNTMIFGWPIVHVAFGHNPRTGEKLIAKGLIAVGDTAIGGLAVGGFSTGIFSIGGVAVGINTVGGLAFGLQAALGGVAIGGYALGGLAIGLIAIGGAANGVFAMGGSANGYIAAGGNANGQYILEGIGKWNPPDFADSIFALTLADSKLPLFVFIATLMLMAGPSVLIAALAFIGAIRSRARGVIDQTMPGPARRSLISAVVWAVVLTILFPILATVQATVVNQLAKPVPGQHAVVQDIERGKGVRPQ